MSVRWTLWTVGAAYLLWVGLVVGAAIMGGCASKTNFDCSIWSQKDADIQAKRDYCFPDCPSCGPAFRGPYNVAQ